MTRSSGLKFVADTWPYAAPAWAASECQNRWAERKKERERFTGSAPEVHTRRGDGECFLRLPPRLPVSLLNLSGFQPDRCSRACRQTCSADRADPRGPRLRQTHLREGVRGADRRRPRAARSTPLTCICPVRCSPREPLLAMNIYVSKGAVELDPGKEDEGEQSYYPALVREGRSDGRRRGGRRDTPPQSAKKNHKKAKQRRYLSPQEGNPAGCGARSAKGSSTGKPSGVAVQRAAPT